MTWRAEVTNLVPSLHGETALTVSHLGRVVHRGLAHTHAHMSHNPSAADGEKGEGAGRKGCEAVREGGR